MKRFFLIFIVCLTFIINKINAQEENIINFENNIINAEKNQFNINEKNINITDYKYNLTYERIYIKVNPDTLFLEGNVTFYFQSNVTSLDSMLFDFSDSLSIDSVVYQQSLTSFTHSNDIINVQLPNSITYDILDSLKIYYHGFPDTVTAPSAISLTYHDVNKPIIATMSEPYDTKYWMPCKQDLNDKIDSIDFYIQHPQGNRAASNGILVGIDTIGADLITHWKHRYPIDYYLIAFAVTNYEDFTFYHHNNFDNDSIPIVNYIYPENIADTTAILKINDILDLYDSLFIPYPFPIEKYGHAQFNWLGGMEHQTMSFVYNFGFELIAHEFAHQWFGDYITTGSWHDIWLNEGFATYLVGLCYENLLNGYWWPIWKSLQVDAITQQPDGSVFCDDTTSVSRIFDSRLSYKKGGYILHMLRWILGDSAFFQGINDYLNDATLRYGTALTSDLKYHLETAGDTSLTEYFNDWYYGQGYPYYTIKWSQEVDTINIKIDQTPSDISVSFFEMKVPLQIWRQGSDTIIVLNNQMNNQYFQCPIQGNVDSVIFDPDMWLIAKDTVINTTNIDLQINSEINIYPNPAKTKIYINLTDNEIANNISISNIKGKNVIQISKKRSNYILDISKLTDGIYFIKVITNKSVFIRTIEIIN